MDGFELTLDQVLEKAKPRQSIMKERATLDSDLEEEEPKAASDLSMPSSTLMFHKLDLFDK